MSEARQEYWVAEIAGQFRHRLDRPLPVGVYLNPPPPGDFIDDICMHERPHTREPYVIVICPVDGSIINWTQKQRPMRYTLKEVTQ